MIVVLAFTLIVCCYVLNYKWSRKRLLKCMEQFDGPPLVPFFGNALEFATNTKTMIKTAISFGEKYRSPFRMWLFHLPFVVVGRPEDIQIVSSKHLEKDTAYRFLTDLLGNGLVTCNNTEWKRRRRIVNPAFSMATLVNSYVHIFNKHSCQLTRKLKTECGTGKHFDLWPYLMNASFNSVCETTMGYAEDEKTNSEIISANSTYFKASVLVGRRFYQPWLRPTIIFKIYTYLTGCANVFKDAQKIPKKVVQDRRMSTTNRTAEDKINKEKSSKNLIDILTSVHPNSESFNDEEMTDEILTILFAGTETTAIIDGFTCLMLAIKPDIQEKVFEEQRKIFGDSHRMPTTDDLSKMTFLEQCIKESLRWASIIPVVIRRTDEDITISNGYVIPAGVRIFISLHTVHHDKETYSNPNTWDPDHFQPDKVASRHPGSFIPFGTGLRMCLGNKYAVLSIKTTISTIIRNYKLSTDRKENEIELDFDFVIRSGNGYPVKLEYRHGDSIF